MGHSLVISKNFLRRIKTKMPSQYWSPEQLTVYTVITNNSLICLMIYILKQIAQYLLVWNNAPPHIRKPSHNRQLSPTWYLRYLQQWLWRLIPPGMWCHVLCQLLTTLHDPISQNTVILILQYVLKWHTWYSDFVWEFSGIWNVYGQIDHKLTYALIDTFWGSCHLMKRCKSKKGKF